ncbi:MAG: AI-2E family transporter [Bulleidia sp.]|nr:AI-2E family transporter [Bulleidia sp.]
MRYNFDESTKQNIRTYTISGALVLCIWFLFSRWDAVASFFSRIFNALQPFLWGLAIAFILMPIQRVVENSWLKNTKQTPKARHRTAIAISMVIFLLILTAFFAVLIPQLVSSFRALAESMDSYMTTMDNYLNSVNETGRLADIVDKAMTTIQKSVTDYLSGPEGLLSTVVDYSMSMVKGILNFFMGIIVAIYLMNDTKRWKRQFKQVSYALFPKNAAEFIFHVGRLTADMLDKFIFGKALDSLIIGLICGLVCAIMNMPYTPLIAFIVGLTNMIPVFGPFIGAIPCAFILLIIHPIKALEFVIFIIILQQIDGNIIGPRILGGSMGLPALWVMFAILLGGALNGVLGMFLGVPLFSVVYILVREHSARRVREKGIDLRET